MRISSAVFCSNNSKIKSVFHLSGFLSTRSETNRFGLLYMLSPFYSVCSQVSSPFQLFDFPWLFWLDSVRKFPCFSFNASVFCVSTHAVFDNIALLASSAFMKFRSPFCLRLHIFVH